MLRQRFQPLTQSSQIDYAKANGITRQNTTAPQQFRQVFEVLLPWQRGTSC
jgi:hypothetical protein